jgi:dihydrolipoamide dehydrogenase
MQNKDVVVIGGGPAGYASAIRAAQLGAKVTLVEQTSLGGTCVSRGCIPVKALVRAAELVELGKSARDYGVNYQEAGIDFARMIARKDTVVKTVTSGVKLLLEGNGVEVVSGSARFLSPSEIEVDLTDGTTSSIVPGRTIIATGAKSFAPDGLNGWGGKVVTTDEALSLTGIPGSMAIIGGGFIGLAFATIFCRLGTRVTVVEESARLLPEIDAEIVSVVERELKKNKVQIVFGASLSRGMPPADSEMVLVAEARRANIDGLGLERAGVTLNEKGGIRVNNKMETGVAGVFAAGDVTVEFAAGGFTHVAYAQGIAAAENAVGKDSRVDYSVVPLCVNTLPEIAAFGLTEEKARQQGYGVKVGRFPMAANAVATVLGQRTGLIKIISDEKYGQILGAHIVGPQASSLISEIALAAKLEATPADIASLMHAHPTLAEVSWEAALDSSSRAIHMLSQK